MEEKNLKVVLITGAAGFLGSHLANKFINEDYFVVGFDNFSSSNADSTYFLSLLENEKYVHIFGDICDAELVEKVFNTYSPDIVLNFACPASPPKYQEIPIQTMLTNVVGINNILRNASKFYSKVVQASTSEIYGDPILSPQLENYKGNVNSYGPRACYDEGKRAAEALCYDYSSLGTDVRVIRIFNTYGPHMDPHDGRVVSNFIRQTLNDEPMTIFGKGEQTRSFCYVDDLVDGIWKVSQADIGILNGPINLGNPVEFTIMDLVKIIAKVIGKTPKYTFDELPIDDPTQRKPDITKANILLNWEPKISLEEGIKKSLSWFKQNS